MTGTLINILTVIAGSVLGIIVGGRLPERVKATVMDGLGLATIAIGLEMTLDTNNAVIMVGSLVLGGVLGELLDLDAAVTRLGETMERMVLGGKSRDEGSDSEQKGRFAKGFVAASLLFCIGPMAIMGSIQDGLSGDYTMLSVKSMLDGFMSVLFASSFGIGVAFSVLTIALYQGSITLLAGLLQNFLTEAMIAEFTATGGVLVFAIGLGIVGIKKIKVANLLPGVFLAPIISYIVSRFLI
jgi:uncharacterized membrane protein YqgA involved in biofilm formation